MVVSAPAGTRASGHVWSRAFRERSGQVETLIYLTLIYLDVTSACGRVRWLSPRFCKSVLQPSVATEWRGKPFLLISQLPAELVDVAGRVDRACMHELLGSTGRKCLKKKKSNYYSPLHGVSALPVTVHAALGYLGPRGALWLLTLSSQWHLPLGEQATWVLGLGTPGPWRGTEPGLSCSD